MQSCVIDEMQSRVIDELQGRVIDEFMYYTWEAKKVSYYKLSLLQGVLIRGAGLSRGRSG